MCLLVLPRIRQAEKKKRKLPIKIKLPKKKKDEKKTALKLLRQYLDEDAAHAAAVGEELPHLETAAPQVPESPPRLPAPARAITLPRDMEKPRTDDFPLLPPTPSRSGSTKPRSGTYVPLSMTLPRNQNKSRTGSPVLVLAKPAGKESPKHDTQTSAVQHAD